jgi:hypothetical protein
VVKEVSYPQEEVFIPEDGFCQALQAIGQTLVRHRCACTDPLVLRQRWLVTPTGRQYNEKAFYEAFDHIEFRRALRLAVGRSIYIPLKKFMDLELSMEQLIFLEEQEFLMRIPTGDMELKDVLDRGPIDTHQKSWIRGPTCQKIIDIGHTLEWYVAEWFRNEYHALARYGVETKELAGEGDLDVVAFKNGVCTMVECKSTSKVGAKELCHFLRRCTKFPAQMSVLLMDTEHKEAVEMRTKQLRTLLELPAGAALKKPHGKTMFYWLPGYNIYITNTGAGIATTLEEIMRFHEAVREVRGYR